MATATQTNTARIVAVNHAFTEITGYSSEEAVGQNQSLVSNHSMPREFYQDLWQTISQGEPWTGRLINRRKDGSKYLAELSISPVVNASGCPLPEPSCDVRRS